MKDSNIFIIKIILHAVYTSCGEIYSSYLAKSEIDLGHCDFPRKMSSFKYIYMNSRLQNGIIQSSINIQRQIQSSLNVLYYQLAADY